jgi:hypothetical protein
VLPGREAQLALSVRDGHVPPAIGHAVPPVVPPFVGHGLAIRLDGFTVVVTRRRSGEPVSLVLTDELVVDQAVLVHVSALLVELGFGTVALGLLLGDAGVALGDVSLLVPVIRLVPVPRYGAIASLIDLALTGASTRTRDHHHHGKQDHDEYGDDDYDQYSGGHTALLQSVGLTRARRTDEHGVRRSG